MAKYIGCRKCDSPDCKGCNLKNLETMLNNGKFDCLMNGNRCINPSADVAPVRHGRWGTANDGTHFCSHCGCDAPYAWDDIDRNYINSADDVPDRISNYCPNCGADMRGDKSANK